MGFELKAMRWERKWLEWNW